MNIAIIGTGISGLGAAYLLNPHHNITVYEKNAYIGGHSRTIQLPSNIGAAPVDTGFIVFNNRNYPNLTALFEKLNVPIQKSDMSFGASIADGWLEYGSKGIFAQKRNLGRPMFWKMLVDILRFNRKAMRYLENNNEATLEECLNDLNVGKWFKEYYLLAMGAAIWSCPLDTVLKFPARTFIRFFDNHGLLSLKDHPQWYTVSGGSREYIHRLTQPFKDRIRTNCAVDSVSRENGKVTIRDKQGNTDTFDQVVFACHANQAIKMNRTPTPAEKEILQAFSYQKNKIVVHGDTTFMPKNRNCWASWVYLAEEKSDKRSCISLSYWMNNLQSLDANIPVIVTLNPGRQPKKHLIYDEHEFSHPVFDGDAIDAQENLELIQGQDNCWYCGAYQRNGFHEDGLLSAVQVARKMGVSIPWN